jgi:hypothetical protein
MKTPKPGSFGHRGLIGKKVVAKEANRVSAKCAILALGYSGRGGWSLLVDGRWWWHSCGGWPVAPWHRPWHVASAFGLRTAIARCPPCALWLSALRFRALSPSKKTRVSPRHTRGCGIAAAHQEGGCCCCCCCWCCCCWCCCCCF